MLLRLKSEGVDVDTNRRGTSVVLPRLDLVKVGSLTLRESVLTVELDLGDLNRVLALALDARGKDDLGKEVVGGTLKDAVIIGEVAGAGVDTRASGQTRVGRGTKTESNSGHVDARASGGTRTRCKSVHLESARAIGGKDTVAENVHDDALSGPVIRVVEGLLTRSLLDPRNRGRVAVNEGVTLDNPDKFLDGVVKVHLDLVGRSSDGLITSELDLVNEVLVALLGKAPALLRVKVDVVNIEGSSDKLELGDGSDTITEILDGSRGGRDTPTAGRDVRIVTVAAVVVLLELNIDTNLVVLEGDEGDGKTRVAAVPELEGDVEGLHGAASAGHAAVGELRGSASGIKSNTGRRLEEDKIGGVTDHLIKGGLSTDGLGKLGPDLHPVTVLPVNARSTDLNLDLLDEAVTNVVEPPETITRNGEGDLGESDLNVRAVHQVSVTGDDGSDTSSEVSLSVEGDLNRLHSEVGVPLVENLPESNLGGTRDVDILSTIADKLHKTTTHFVVCVKKREKNARRALTLQMREFRLRKYLSVILQNTQGQCNSS